MHNKPYKKNGHYVSNNATMQTQETNDDCARINKDGEIENNVTIKKYKYRIVNNKQ